MSRRSFFSVLGGAAVAAVAPWRSAYAVGVYLPAQRVMTDKTLGISIRFVKEWTILSEVAECQRSYNAMRSAQMEAVTKCGVNTR